MNLNPFSLTTAPAYALSSSGETITQGTVFFYKRDESWLYLVTNWHVVADRDPTDPRKIRAGPVPVTLRLKLHEQLGTDTIRLSKTIDFDLVLNDENGETPEWIEHPDLAYRCDMIVVRIPLHVQLHDRAQFLLLDEISDLQRNYDPGPMSDAFVIGYPWGESSGDGVLPLYKRGSIASEPLVNHGGLPRMLIDCRTASGMSGAPVLAAASGLFAPSGQFDGDTVFGTVTNFVGVYSGRLTGVSEPNDRRAREVSELGIVWKKSALDAILANGRAGTKLSTL